MTDWITVSADHLQMVPEALWHAAHERQKERRAKHNQWRRNPQEGEPDGRGVRKRYLLAGYGRCGTCGGSMQVVSRASSGSRIFRYVCSTYWNRGASACRIGRMIDMATADSAVRELLATEILRPRTIERAIDIVLEQFAAEEQNGVPRRQILIERLAEVETRLANLAETAARGGAVPAILQALEQHDRERQALNLEIAAIDRQTPRLSARPAALRRQLHTFLADWDGLLTAQVSEARTLLNIVLDGRMTFEYVPKAGRRGHFNVTIPIAFDRVLRAGVPEFAALQDLGEKVASPTGFEPVFWP
jgi:hypothetical protein